MRSRCLRGGVGKYKMDDYEDKGEVEVERDKLIAMSFRTCVMQIGRVP